MEKVSAIIIDEISMIKAWMIAYIDARMREATQINEPFGGKAVIMLGDFDQQPPVAGVSLPHLAMILLQEKYKERSSTIHIKRTKQEKVEMNSQLSHTKVKLFKKAGLVRLTTQHRCAEDADHIALLDKMSSGSPITPADLEPYETLSKKDLTVGNFLFATIIVTGNYERHELNAHQAKLWAQYYRTHVIRWRRKIDTSAWQGKPATAKQIDEAQKETCFWEYFMLMAPAYLTYNLNTDMGLVNGTDIRQHSLAFTSQDDETYINSMKHSTPFDNTIDLPNPPAAVNVEMYPDYEGDDEAKRTENKRKRNIWPCRSLTDDGRIVIPISIAHQNLGRWSLEAVHAQGGAVRFRASKVKMKDYSPIELGFYLPGPFPR